MSDHSSPRPQRNLPDLSRLYDSFDDPKVCPEIKLPEQRDSAAVEPGQNLQFISPKLQPYLPADLWRKLNSGSPRRGLFINALERLRSLLHTLSTYLPGDLVQEKINRPIPGLVNGKMLKGCLLFADVSGFTALSERFTTLGPEGAEHLTKLINQYFTTMIEILAWSNGTLVKFAGDATLVYFPEQEHGTHVQWATRAGLRMLRAIKAFADLPTPLGPVTLSLKVGLSAGSFLAASIGSPSRMEYALIGSAVSQTLLAEGCATPGQMVVNQLAADLLAERYPLNEVKPGFFLLNPEADSALDDFEIRPQPRRARGTSQWDASLEEITAEIENVLCQIQSLTPYLASEVVDRIIAHASPRQVASEYRPTTVMFCNFTGPEALLETWGESGLQRVTSLLSAYFRDMNEMITRFGGIVSRIDPFSQGTKLLVLFGAPVAHEDDPERAVSAALAMNNALEALNRRWEQKFARHLPPGRQVALIKHRIGLTSGETFAGQAGSNTRREYTVMGDEVNLAARLMSAAHPGQILISERVFECTNHSYVNQKLPPVRVKGKKKPLPVWQVDGPRDETLLNRLRTRPKLIGHEIELASGWQSLQRACAGSGNGLTLTGPAGIGKSHLADTLLQKALEQGFQICAYQCRSHLATAAEAGWVGILRSLTGITSLDHPLIQKGKLERCVSQFHLSPTEAAGLAGLLGLRQGEFGLEKIAKNDQTVGEDFFQLVKQTKVSRKASNLALLSEIEAQPPVSGQETTQRRQALIALLTAIAIQKPLIIFFEDAHWLDAASQASLLPISQALAAQPVAFLLACRPGEVTLEIGDSLQLNPFTPAETSALVAEILTAGLTEIIHAESHGNPLFVEEISRWIRRTHRLDELGLKSALQTSDILQKLVLSNLETLLEGQREVARLASVVGVEFRHSEIEALLDTELDPVTLSQNLSALKQAGWIVVSEASIDARYTFLQPLYQEVLYASLPFERRRELHARLAEHLQTLPTRRRQLRDKIAVFLETEPANHSLWVAKNLAYHNEMSGNWLKAAHQLIEMAEISTPAEKESHFQQALALLERYPPEIFNPEIGLQKARAYLGLGDIALQRGDLAASAAAYTSAAELDTSAEFPPKLATGLAARLALVLPSQGKIEFGEDQLTRLINQKPELDNWKLHILLAWLTWRTGCNASPKIAACWELLPPTDAKDYQRGCALLADLSGDWEQATETYQKLGELNGAALANVRLGDQFLRQGNFTQADQHYATAFTLWQTLPSACGLALVYYRQAELAWQTDQRSSVISLMEAALASLDQSPPVLQSRPRVTIQYSLARIKNNHAGAWETWNWQPLEDLTWIQVCFPIFCDVSRSVP